MKAIEALKITQRYPKALNTHYDLIKAAAHQGKTSITIPFKHEDQGVYKHLQKDGYETQYIEPNFYTFRQKPELIISWEKAE